MKNKKTEEAKVFEETMETELRNRKTIPDDVKNKRDENVFRNLVFAIGVIVYFIILNLGYFFIEKSIYTRDSVVFSFVALIATIVLFEKAYRMEKGFFAIHGLEALAVAIYTYFIPYTYFNLDNTAVKVLMIIPVFFGVYYCIKGIAICIKAGKNNKNDIKDIIKKEEIKNDDVLIDIDKDAEIEKEENLEIKDEAKKIKKATSQKKKTTTSKKIKTTKKTEQKGNKAKSTKADPKNKKTNNTKSKNTKKAKKDI